MKTTIDAIMGQGIKCLLIAFFLVTGIHAQEDAARAFDFWVGEWDVKWYAQDSSVVKGSNRIEKILDGKVLQEHFEDPNVGFKGTSISVYNPQKQSWYQSWADNQGGYFHFKGIIDGGQRIFTMTEPGRGGAIYRMVFSDITPQSLTWTWEATQDEGKTWNTAWQIFYSRVE
jgi:hypothetical protein